MSSEGRLLLLARYEPPGWRDPPPCCPTGEHDWTLWRAHPNGANDVRACRRHFQDAEGRRRDCWFSDWRLHEHSFSSWPGEDATDISCGGLGCRVRQPS